MLKPFRTAAVLGAGIMGSQIACHLANVGMKVYLLDIAANKDNKNEIVEANFQKTLSSRLKPVYTDRIVFRITLGNFEEHFHHLADLI